LDQPIFVLTGEIDVYTAEATHRVLDAIGRPAVIDLSGGKGTFTLAKMQPQVLRVLQIAGFYALFLFDVAPVSENDIAR
jgi:hypothetical protein